MRQEGPPHHSVVVSSLLGLFDECWRKVMIGFSSIWQHQTLSNYFRPTTKPSVDVVPGLSYAVISDSLNWPGGSRLNVGGRLAC